MNAKSKNLTYKNLIRYLRKLKRLVANNNTKITNVNSFSNLEMLYADGESGITQDGLSQLTKLKQLSVDNNRKITNVNSFSELEDLRAQGESGSMQDGIS